MRNLRLLLSLLLVLSLTVLSVAQQDSSTYKSPYQLSWAVDLPVSAVALGAGISYLVLHSQTPPMTEAYINGLNRADVWAFERPTTYNWSKPIALGSDVLLYTSFAIPFALLADNKVRKDWVKIGVIYAETFALAAAVTSLTKNLTKRPRPFVYNPTVDVHEKQDVDAQYAFFSGHTSMTAAMCFMTAKIFNDYNKGSKAVPWVWVAAATVPAVTGVLRQQAGKHFWTDVLVGYVVGAGIGILVPELHRAKFFNRKKRAIRKVSF